MSISSKLNHLLQIVTVFLDWLILLVHKYYMQIKMSGMIEIQTLNTSGIPEWFFWKC